MKKVYVNVSVRLIINMDEGANLEEVINEMDYDFSSDMADIHDYKILDYNVEDSK